MSTTGEAKLELVRVMVAATPTSVASKVLGQTLAGLYGDGEGANDRRAYVIPPLAESVACGDISQHTQLRLRMLIVTVAEVPAMTHAAQADRMLNRGVGLVAR